MKPTFLIVSFMAALSMATPTPAEGDQVASPNDQVRASDDLVDFDTRACKGKGGKCTGIKGQCCRGLICTFDTSFKNGKCK
ncbi:unnamed protein product [Clonostachys solani]|uniref:Uncharacterized protein n=1 Tax=Clonostachys solani TaxID=160281 RepID=A0A9N9Z8M6_9HYPO|nr:unnamed protein product [Clonostachys solani]